MMYIEHFNCAKNSKVNSKWPKQSENSNPRITDT